MGYTLALLISALLASTSYEESYFIFTIQNIKTDGQAREVFMPMRVEGPAEPSWERKAHHIFNQLHAPRAAIWGNTSLQLTSDQSGKISGTLHLDPTRTEFHPYIIAELYLSMSAIGITNIVLQPEGRTLSAADVHLPYYSLVVPAAEALPPRQFANAIVRLPSGGFISATDFYAKVAAKDPALVAELLSLLANGANNEKTAVMTALPAISPKDSTAKLLPMLKDPEEAVRLKAIELLQAQTDAAVVNAIAEVADKDKKLDVRLAASRYLVGAGRQEYAIYLLLDKLKSRDRKEVLDTIARLGASQDRRILPALETMMSSEDQEISQAAFTNYLEVCEGADAATLLESEKTPGAFKLLAAERLLKDKDQANVTKGVEYLVRRGTDEQVLAALRTLEMRKLDKLAPLLAELFKDQRAPIAREAVECAGRMGLVQLLPELADAEKRPDLGDSPKNVSMKLVSSLDFGKILALAASKEAETRAKAFVTVSSFLKDEKNRPKVLDLMKKGLKDPVAEIRMTSATALLNSEDPKFLPELLWMAKDQDAGLRELAVKASARSANAKGDELIMSLMDDPSDAVKLAVMAAIAERKLKDAKERLRFRLTLRDPKLRAAALRTIVALNETHEDHEAFFDAYQAAVIDPDNEIRLAGLDGIKWVRNDTVAFSLQDMALTLNEDPRVRAKTMEAMGTTRNPDVIESLARGLSDKDKLVQGAAILALRSLSLPGCEVPLQEFVANTDNDELRFLAQEALDQIKTQQRGFLQP